MNKERYHALKEKITPKENKLNIASSQDRFMVADNILTPPEELKKKQVVTRKTFSIPEKELINFNKIKNRALDYRVVVSDSEIVRLGLILISDLDDKNFHEKICNINKVPTGRPKSA